MPTGRIAVRRSGEGASAKDEQVATTVEEIGNGRVSRFGNDGTLREDEEASLGIGERGGELIGGEKTRFRKNLSKLPGRSNDAISGRKAGLGPHYRV